MTYAEERFIPIDERKKYYYHGTWLQLTRPLTLSGTITPILVGTGFAYKEGTVSLSIFLVFLVASVLIQMTVNMFNDYFDFLHGQDEEKWTEDKADAKSGIPLYMIPIVGSMILFIACVGGIWLAWMSHSWILVVGAISIFAGIKYSAGKHAFAAIGMGEIIAFLFLGVVVTTLSYVVQTKVISLEIIFVSILFGCLIATMILTNNIRDMEKDRPFRMTLPIIVGRKRAVWLLIGILVVLYSLVILLVLLSVLSWTALLVFMALPIARKLLQSFRSTATEREVRLGMKWAAYHHLVFGLLLAIVVWL